MLDGLDSGGTPEQFAGRQWLATTNGLWLTGFGTGGWFVPHGEGLAFQTDWRIDLPFSTIDRWFKWKDGQILGIQFGRGGFIADETALLANSQRKTSVKIFQTDKPLIQTADGEIFGFFRGQPRVLQEWDGKTWREHPLPEKVQLNSHEILTDSLNRVWWIHLPYGSPDATPSYLFDPARGKFEIFANYPAALQAQLRSHPGLQIGANEVYAPKFSADGRICFEDTYWKLYYFNGHTWREWEKAKISSPQTWYQSIVNPFFASDGSLSITLKKSIWQFTELEGWRSTNSAAEAKTTTSKPTLQRPPAIAALSRADSLVTDRLGTSWFTADNRLFRSAYGQNHAWFSPTDAEPFVDGRKLVGALIDKAGNVFLKTSTAGHEEYVYSPMPFAAPDTSAKRIREDGDTVQIELAATGTDTPRFSWRVDDEPWSVAQTGRSVVLDDLPAGQHRFQAVAINDRFQADATPAEVTFETRTAPTKNIAKWIAQLGDKNFAMRAAAVKYLSHHADVALPALQQARDQETDRDRRWWLDAAIQQCK